MDKTLLEILCKWEAWFMTLTYPDGALFAAGEDGLEALRQVSTRAMSPILLLAWIGDKSDPFSTEIRVWAENAALTNSKLPF